MLRSSFHPEWLHLNDLERIELEGYEDALREMLQQLALLKGQRRALLDRGRSRMYRRQQASVGTARETAT